MILWDKPLNRDTIDDFFRMFSPAAYRSAYRILGDTTRTENALLESFLEVYQQRNKEEDTDLVFLFSEILQKRVQVLAARYPNIENTRQVRSIDEFTTNSLLDELHRRIDSTPFRILDIITSPTTSKTNVQAAPVLEKIRGSGLTLLLLAQLVLVAILIYMVVSVGADHVFDISKLAPANPASLEAPLADYLVPALNYLPVLVNPNTASSEAAAAGSEESTPLSGESVPSEQQSENVSSSAANSEAATVSATRG